ncbi:class I SAM-dependent methyltransferase [Terrimonas sp. NA20]|uniref:Class I SAM-dependent methyltransferase n=1 Tax=Terrimonas ginsenosidimutans TaxID=2908004 RepID=A0ABS9KRP6_9BACT|nr:class I SAM-dependent methyltransferase [Terrimonas ginsenosidimutans]
MEEEKFLMFRNRLTKVYKHLGKQARRLGVSCYRVYDHDLPEFPLCIEFYNDKLYVAEYKRRHNMSEEEHDNWMEKTLTVVSELLSVDKENIFLKLRQRKPGRLGQYQRVDVSQNEFVATENSLQFIINLSDFLDTGLFLDHRTTRQMVRDKSEGKKVLNLFAYTGSFSVYAAAGGASEVVTADLSNTYLKWAERNMVMNGFEDPAKYRFEQTDVMQYLKTLPADHYDIIVMDPPTFSNSKRMDGILDIQRDHVSMINDCMRALKKDGVLYFSTNARTFVLDEKSIQASSLKNITKATTPFDFEGRLFRWCYYLVK